MSIIKKGRATCTCGNNLDFTVALSLNITTHPQYWPEIYSGELNSSRCNECGKRLFWPSPFVFYDMDRKIMLNVLMRPFESKIYLPAKAIDFINEYHNHKVHSQLPELAGYDVATVFNLDDLKSKIHSKIAGLNINEVQFIEYALENSISCEECSTGGLKFLFERIEGTSIGFRTICMDCSKISMVYYDMDKYKKALTQVKLFAKQEASNEILIG